MREGLVVASAPERREPQTAFNVGQASEIAGLPGVLARAEPERNRGVILAKALAG